LAPRWYSQETAREIDLAVRRIVDTAFERALTALRHNRIVLEESSRALLAAETLVEHELRAFFDRLEHQEEDGAEPLRNVAPTSEALGEPVGAH
jgi:ATP-dependent Zn protease